jgi:hypothetical protein
MVPEEDRHILVVHSNCWVDQIHLYISMHVSAGEQPYQHSVLKKKLEKVSRSAVISFKKGSKPSWTIEKNNLGNGEEH